MIWYDGAIFLEIIRIVFEKSSYPVLGFCHLTYFLLIKENAFFLVALLRESSCRLKFRALSNCEFLIRSEAAKAQWDQSFSGVAFALSSKNYDLLITLLKVCKFQNEFMNSSFLPKHEQQIVKISALNTQGRNPDNFLFVFWEK